MNKPLAVFIEKAINDSFYIERLDKSEQQTAYPNRLSYHRILLVESGTGTLKIDEQVFQLAGKELFLMAKGQVYFFEPTAIVTGYVLCFGDCFWEKAPASASNCKAVLFNNAAANQRLPLVSEVLKEFVFLFEMLRAEFVKGHYINQIDVLAAYLKVLMIKIANLQLTDESRVDSQDYIVYRKFLEFLSADFKVVREVAVYAEKLGVTARRLSDLCRRCSGKTAKEIINGQLVAEAKRSLQFSSSSVKEIAYQLSFITPEQFSHFFKKNTDFSPADYRNYFVSIGN